MAHFFSSSPQVSTRLLTLLQLLPFLLACRSFCASRPVLVCIAKMGQQVAARTGRSELRREDRLGWSCRSTHSDHERAGIHRRGVEFSADPKSDGAGVASRHPVVHGATEAHSDGAFFSRHVSPDSGGVRVVSSGYQPRDTTTAQASRPGRGRRPTTIADTESTDVPTLQTLLNLANTFRSLRDQQRNPNLTPAKPFQKYKLEAQASGSPHLNVTPVYDRYSRSSFRSQWSCASFV